MFGGTRRLDSTQNWDSIPPRVRSRATGAKAVAKRLVLSAFQVTDHVPEECGALVTFDDGPDPEITPRVLDLLAKYDVKAIFFVVGNRIPRAPHMLQEILDAGHLLGNHTFSHPLDGVPGLHTYLREIRKCQNAIHALVGESPNWFRAPLGALTVASLLGPRVAGLHSLLWSVDVGDWKLRNTPDAVVAGQRLADQIACGDIVLLHDDNPHVVTVLETALPQIHSQICMDRALTTLAGV